MSEDVLVDLGVALEADGEFWMNYSDFCKFFTRVYICTQGPDFDHDGLVDKSKNHKSILFILMCCIRIS